MGYYNQCVLWLKCFIKIKTAIAMKHLIFVYGTLKKGFPNHDRYMRSAEKLGNYRTAENYPLVLIGKRYVPCMINAPGEGQQIEGELYEVDDDCLKKLDVLERIKEPDGYRRFKISLKSIAERDGPALEAHAYLIAPQFAKDRRSDYLKIYSLQDAKKYNPRKKS
jgi:gamma-glutamylaminecyclotransferase